MFFNKIKQTNNPDGYGRATWENKQKVQFFLAYLMALLAGRPRFRLVVDLAVGLTISLAIGGAELMCGEIVIGFLVGSL